MGRAGHKAAVTDAPVPAGWARAVVASVSTALRKAFAPRRPMNNPPARLSAFCRLLSGNADACRCARMTWVKRKRTGALWARYQLLLPPAPATPRAWPCGDGLN